MAAGARSATIYSAGFGETGAKEGRELGRQLAEVIAEIGVSPRGWLVCSTRRAA